MKFCSVIDVEVVSVRPPVTPGRIYADYLPGTTETNSSIVAASFSSQTV